MTRHSLSQQRPVWRISIFYLLFIALLLSVTPVQAQTPVMQVTATWSPGSQLVSLTDDQRFADLVIAVTGNVRFWAVQLQCTVGNGTQLGDPTMDFAAWGDHYAYPPTGAEAYASNGVLNLTISRVGWFVDPLGTNGISSTTTLVTLRFPINTLSLPTSISVNCQVMQFFDRNGHLIFQGRYVPAPPLQLLLGYNVYGNVTVQGASPVSGISISCVPASGGMLATTTTDRLGNFNFVGNINNLLRSFGRYTCDIEWHNHDNYLKTQIVFDLQTPTLRLLPITLRGGDSDAGGVVEIVDAAVLTANWNMVGVPFNPSDLNGDTRTNQSDLAILMGNVRLGEYRNDGATLNEHVVTAFPTELWSYPFPHSYVRWGELIYLRAMGPKPVLFQAPGVLAYFWPDVSADGTQIVYTGVDARGKHGIYTFNLVTGQSLRLTPPTYSQEAFAPSWSPDGSKIAFVCSTSARYLLNRGDLCMVNANDTSGASIVKLANDTYIQKPAWYNERNLLYAQGYSIWILSVPSGYTWQYLWGSQRRFDMPVAQRLGTTTYLYYRYSGDGIIQVHWGIPTTEPDGDIVGWTAGGTVPFTEDVDYFTVAPGLHVMLYKLNSLTWRYVWNGNPHYAPAVGNPVYNNWGGGYGEPTQEGWLGNPSWPAGAPHPASPGSVFPESTLFPYRATIDWLP